MATTGQNSNKVLKVGMKLKDVTNLCNFKSKSSNQSKTKSHIFSNSPSRQADVSSLETESCTPNHKKNNVQVRSQEDTVYRATLVLRSKFERCRDLKMNTCGKWLNTQANHKIPAISDRPQPSISDRHPEFSICARCYNSWKELPFIASPNSFWSPFSFLYPPTNGALMDDDVEVLARPR